MALTAKQKRFADEYLIDTNGKQAAIRAGYSEKTANEQASRLLTNVNVKSYIDERMKEIEAENIADAKEVMKYLTSVMRGEHTEEVPVLCGDGCQELTPKEVSAKDRLKAAELLGKRYGMFTDKMSVEGVIPVVITDDLEEDDGSE